MPRVASPANVLWTSTSAPCDARPSGPGRPACVTACCSSASFSLRVAAEKVQASGQRRKAPSSAAPSPAASKTCSATQARRVPSSIADASVSKQSQTSSPGGASSCVLRFFDAGALLPAPAAFFDAGGLLPPAAAGAAVRRTGRAASSGASVRPRRS